MLLLSIFFLLFHSAFGIDVVVESVKRINHSNLAACGNFYRYNCPLGYENLVEKDIISEIKERVKSHHDESWNQFEFIDDFKNYDGLLFAGEMYEATQSLPDFSIMSLTELVVKRCDSKQFLEPLYVNFQKLITFGGTVPSNLTLQQFIECDSNSRSLVLDELLSFGKQFEIKFPIEKTDKKSILVSPNFTKLFVRAQQAIRDRRAQMIGARMMKNDEKILRGVEIVEQMIEKMREIAIHWIDNTRWVAKNQAKILLTEKAEKIYLETNYEMLVEETAKFFNSIDSSYKTCKSDIVLDDELGNMFCLLAAFVEKEFEEYDQFKSDHAVPMMFVDNGFNSNSEMLRIAFPMYMAAASIEEEAGMIGLVGSLVGHEIGHTFDKEAIPFFSNISAGCVFQLYQDTCKEFKEKPCDNVSQERETTSDIIGQRLSYELFKKTYGERTKKIYPKLNITFEQLFFHAAMVRWCKPGETYHYPSHPAENVRANVIAEIPAFETAFNCPSDSPMAKLIEGECAIYGENAPDTRRKRN